MQSTISSVASLRRGLNLLHGDSSVIELRAFQKTKSNRPITISGFYADVCSLADDLITINKLDRVSGGTTCYVTLNPINPSWQLVNNSSYQGTGSLVQEIEDAGGDPALSPRLNARKNLNQGGQFFTMRTTEDSDILKRTNILIDVDAGQPSETNSNEFEKARAYDLTLAVKNYLVSLGFPEPALCDSGNGYHLILKCDLPNTDESTTLVRRFLLALSEKFSGQGAHIDTAVFNAARITKAYGTLVCKGKSTSDRPHRLSGVLSDGAGVPVPVELLTSIANTYTQPIATPQEEGKSSDEEQQYAFDLMKKRLTFYGIEHDTAYTTRGIMVIPVECPNAADHTTQGAPSETVVSVKPNGKLGFNCKHAHCVGLTWAGFKKLIEDKFSTTHPNAPQFKGGVKIFVGKTPKSSDTPTDLEGHSRV